RVYPAVAVILEIRIQQARVNVRSFTEFVIRAARDAPARAVVAVFANVDGIFPQRRRPISQSRQVRNRLNIIDTPARPVVGAAHQNPELLLTPESLSYRCGGF